MNNKHDNVLKLRLAECDISHLNLLVRLWREIVDRLIVSFSTIEVDVARAIYWQLITTISDLRKQLTKTETKQNHILTCLVLNDNLLYNIKPIISYSEK